MKIFLLLISFVFVSLDSLCSKTWHIGDNSGTKISIQPIYEDNLMDTLACNKEKSIYQLIYSGVENDIRNYFRHINYDVLVKSDSGSVVRALNKIAPNERITHTIWIMEEVKNRNLDIRNHVYSELLKVDYSKPNFMVKTLINNYFTNLREPDDNLAKKVAELQKRMNR